MAMSRTITMFHYLHRPLPALLTSVMDNQSFTNSLWQAQTIHKSRESLYTPLLSMLCKSVKTTGLPRPQAHSCHLRKALLINLVIKTALLSSDKEPHQNLIMMIKWALDCSLMRPIAMNIEWDYSYYQPWSDNEWLVDEIIAMREETLMAQNEDITMQ